MGFCEGKSSICTKAPTCYKLVDDEDPKGKNNQ